MQFTFNNQTQGFGILTNLTSNPSNKYNTYCIYKNCFVDNHMIVFDENNILDVLRYDNRLKMNDTFNQSLEKYQHELYKRILTPNRNYIHLETYNNIPYKHKFLHFLQ